MRRLLIQADDFGMTEGVTRGILHAMSNGVVTGSGAMVCEEEYRQRIARLYTEAQGKLGAHLQLTDGTPVSRIDEIPSLVEETGRFPRRADRTKSYNAVEVLREWRAQLSVLRSLGVEPNHLDTHHSIHNQPGAFEAYCELARETGLPVRGGSFQFNRTLIDSGIRCTDQYACIWTGRPVKRQTLLNSLRAIARCTPQGGSVELGCHPAYLDDRLPQISRYVEHRQDELEVLCHPDLPVMLQELGYELGVSHTRS